MRELEISDGDIIKTKEGWRTTEQGKKKQQDYHYKYQEFLMLEELIGQARVQTELLQAIMKELFKDRLYGVKLDDHAERDLMRKHEYYERAIDKFADERFGYVKSYSSNIMKQLYDGKLFHEERRKIDNNELVHFSTWDLED
mgnify:CR=1 FL=1|tara:strand:+ start:53 stop:478 length:426 start_codon:yes stop_codon:yes gene_type:complete